VSADTARLCLVTIVVSATYGEFGWLGRCSLGVRRMIYFYRRAGDTRTCETRLEAEGPRFELVVSDGHDSRVERFEDAGAMFARELELRHAWHANGWRTIDPYDEVDEYDEKT
jgi:hypothetical protein